MPVNPEPRSFDVDLRIYRLLALQKAAHRYSGNFQISISLVTDNTARVDFKPKSTVQVAGGPLLSNFETELLDQELREAVSAETSAVRNLILAQAFSSANLIDPIGESADFKSDPLDIGRFGGGH